MRIGQQHSNELEREQKKKRSQKKSDYISVKRLTVVMA